MYINRKPYRKISTFFNFHPPESNLTYVLNCSLTLKLNITLVSFYKD